MNKLILLLFAAFIIVTQSFSQDRYLLTVDLKQGKMSPAVGQTIIHFEDVVVLHRDVDLVALAGSRVEDGGIFGGFGLTTMLSNFAKNYRLEFGAYLVFESGRPFSGGLLFGVSQRF